MPSQINIKHKFTGHQIAQEVSHIEMCVQEMMNSLVACIIRTAQLDIAEYWYRDCSIVDIPIW